MAHIRGGITNRVELNHRADNGDSISIGMHEPANVANVWRIVVHVTTDEGFFRLGEFTTTPGTPSRMVAIASCPGARGWTIDATCSTAGAEADLCIADGEGIGAYGVVPLDPPGARILASGSVLGGTSYFPSSQGYHPAAATSIFVHSTSGACVWKVQGSHDSFKTTCFDLTAKATNSVDPAAPHAASYTGDACLFFENLTIQSLRVVANSPGADDVLATAYEAP